MIQYFLLFTGIGFLLSKTIKSEKNGFFVAVAISIIWGFSNQPIWGLVTLGELLVGISLNRVIFKNESKCKEEDK